MGKVKGGFERSRASKLAFAVCLAGTCCTAASFAVARAASPQESGSSSRLVSAKEGREIARAARGHEQPVRGTRDCSHLVHEIYALAGFDYPYASSFDLYAGSTSFDRVKSAQPGDLIVWPGHAGIVFDPGRHTFYSLVRSGLDAEDYEGPYWRSRGKPRFYRYLVGRGGTVVAAKIPPVPRTSGREEPRDATPAVEERSSTSGRSATEASERTAVMNGPAAAGVLAKAVEVPRSIVIAEGRKQPTRDEVAEGISELSSAAGSVLRTDDALKTGTAVVIFERLSVERIEIKRDHGWAFVQMDSRASLAGDETDLNAHSEEVRWELRKRKSGWEAVLPLDRTYIPRDVAVRILAAQLARLTQREGAAASEDAVLKREAQLAHLLSALLESK